jgi:integrase
MKCKACKNEIPDGSIFCNWCGSRQVKEQKKKDEIKVPAPRQLKSGKWNIELRAEGQSITEDTADKCTAKAKAIRAGYLAVKKKPADITLREACTKYIDKKDARLSPSTTEGYKKIRDQYFQDVMDKPLSALSASILDESVELECRRTSRRGKPLSPKTINNAWGFIASVIKRYAPGLDVSDVTVPEVQQTIPTIIDPKQIYHVVKGTPIELPCMLAMWLSLSLSEIKGLTKSKSIVNDQLVITETVVHVNRQDIRKAGAKEQKRVRAYNIPPYIKALIDVVDGDVIVPMTGSAIRHRLKRLLAANNLPHISFHRLRHINASVMAMLNIPEKTANERGGWSSDYTRKKVYTHTFAADRTAADRKIDEYFNGIVE